jgi:hypothetical protein
MIAAIASLHSPVGDAELNLTRSTVVHRVRRVTATNRTAITIVRHHGAGAMNSRRMIEFTSCSPFAHVLHVRSAQFGPLRTIAIGHDYRERARRS